MIKFIENIDIKILSFIQNNLRSNAVNYLMKIFTYLGEFGVFWILLSLVFLFIKDKRYIFFECMISLGIDLITCNVLLKNIVRRTRPYDKYEIVKRLIDRQWDFSFPSGHTGTSFAIAFVLFLNLPKKYSFIFLVIASLIGFSRIYLGVHYPSDVIFGACIGIISAILSKVIYKKIKEKNLKIKSISR